MADYTGTDNLEVMAEAVNYNAFLLDLVRRELHAGEQVVDFGAGIGTFARGLADAGVHLHCIEPDPAQLARIRAGGLAASAGLAALPDGSVDVLYSLNVLEHIYDDVAVLQACHAKLKPGGRLLIYVPAFQVLFSSMDQHVGHFRRYSRGELMRKVRSAGFVVQRAAYVDSAGFFAALLYKVLGNEQGTINRTALVTYDRYVLPISLLADRLLGRVCGKNVWLVAQRS